MSTVKVNPFSREELTKLLVTKADAFTVFRYLRHRESAPRLSELEEQGEAKLPGSAGVLADLYYSLWAPEPGLKEEDLTQPDRRYWRELLSQTLASAAFEELHAKTALQELMSVLGTIAMGETLLALVPEGDQEKLRELNSAQAEADELSEQAKDAQSQANAAQQLADAAANSASTQASMDKQAGQSLGQPPVASSGALEGRAGQLTPDQARARADELAKQSAEAKAEADSLQRQVQEAQAKVEELAEALMGAPGSQEAADKQRQLARLGLATVKIAQSSVEEISDTVQMWGLEPAELTRENFAEVEAILAAIKRNPALQQFQKLLGRLRAIATRKARSKDRGEGVRESQQETGRDLKRAVPSELVALTHPAMRAQAYMRWARGELRLRGQKTRRKLGHGPLVVCEDASGSMDGVKQQWAKALVLALATYAKLQKRSFGWVMFDYIVHRVKIYPRGVLSATQMIEIAQSRAGGGTNFEAPLRAALKMIKDEGLKKADIVLVTDGMCAVSDQFLRELLAVKKALEISIFTVLVNVGETTDETVKEFSDRVIPISELTAEEAGRKVIGIL